MTRSIFKASIKKELWEFNGVLKWVPVALIALLIAIPLLSMALNGLNGEKFLKGVSQLNEFAQTPELQGFFFTSVVSLFAPFILIGLIVQCYYFINCLFDERRDRSVIFWRSLPVSDSVTVGSKLFTGALVIPAIFASAATALFILGAVLSVILALVLNVFYDISVWSFLAQLNVFSSLSAIWLSLIAIALWLLPLYSWLLLTSIYAKKAPFLWAVLPVVAVLIVEGIIVHYLHLSQPWFAYSLKEYLSIKPIIETNNRDLLLPFEAVKLLFNQITLSTFVVSGVFIYATYWFRVNKKDVA
ncbi:hypothetical protein [Pseudoalteromonas tunicata]|jgi:ABC-2 type transport system permease protein|uniref:Putative ABC transporter, permease protein n=1 Tax=Pseudoalteromonas tunicata D2 TaxID=87626 RepID=A4C9W1_9GAMM|nr:hypothetical protein [Pseudoalteromonas tunicata]ATC94716.1 ABC-2 type transport system permease protein [Pseudoalteromonas tunicata]AXT30426.1 ABC transporter permease [Pseudoalteromonas tunicata]EAR28169.1 putative ABC transporter, permease protein [Pseudoalteromonas tunicata D2]